MLMLGEGIIDFDKTIPEDMDGETYFGWQPVDDAAKLHTNVWTNITTVEDAIAFVVEILVNASETDRKTLYDVWIKDNKSSYIQEQIDTEEHDIMIEGLSVLECMNYTHSTGCTNPLSVDIYELETIDHGLSLDQAIHSHALENIQNHMANSIRYFPSDFATTNDTDDLASSYIELVRSIRKKLEARTKTFWGGEVDISAKKDDPYSEYIYRLLQLADALHDFNSTEMQKNFKKGDRPLIPRSAILNTLSTVLPEGLNSIDDIADKATFIKFMHKHKTLTFDSNVVENPLFEIDYFNFYKLDSLLLRVSGDRQEVKAYEKQRAQFAREKNGIKNVEIWCPEAINEPIKDSYKRYKLHTSTNKSVVFLGQILELQAEIEKSYGSSVTFIVDNTDYQMFNMLFATPVLTTGISAVMNVYRGNGFLFSKQRLIHLAGNMNMKPRDSWKFKVCDANIIDGLRIDEIMPTLPQLSHDPTGNVSTIHDNDDFVLWNVKDHDSRYSTNCSSEKHMQPIEHDDYSFAKHSIATTIRKSIRLQSDGGYDKSVNFKKYLDNKRCCDWGQVEHCRLYDTPDMKFVFVTYDRLATQYALYRNVNVIHLLRYNHLPDNTDKHNTSPALLQCVFRICKSSAAGRYIHGGTSDVKPSRWFAWLGLTVS